MAAQSRILAMVYPDYL